MSNDNDRYVTEHDDGWAVVKAEHERASAVFPTQEEAIDRAREIIRNAGGGELVVRGRDGKIRLKDTVAPGPSASAASSTAPEAPTSSAAPEGRWKGFVRKLRGRSS